jgi:putative membrane protein insertion efficiency factor
VRRRRRWIVAGVLLALLTVDFLLPPQRQVSARLLLGAIDLYQATLSPLLGGAGLRCRFQPTCSHYGEAAIRKYGTVKGTWKTAWRIARCGPWTPMGTVDLP